MLTKSKIEIAESRMDSRADFNEMWLSEMPYGIQPGNDLYRILTQNINARVNDGSDVVLLGNDLYKIGQDTIYYWFGSPSYVSLGTEATRYRHGMVINTTAKNPMLAGKPPYASDLYAAIMDDLNGSLRLMSDNSLSDQGYSIWKKLFDRGYKISVYDTTDKQKVGQSFKTFDSVQDMDNYFSKIDPSFRRFQFVLSSPGEALGETRAYFNTRRTRELCGMDLE